MSPVEVLFGIGIAAGIFAGFIWSAYRTALGKGAVRRAHAGTALLTLAGMTALEAAAPLAGQVAGALLILAALAAILVETGWSRLLPLFPLLFGVALVARLPFAG